MRPPSNAASLFSLERSDIDAKRVRPEIQAIPIKTAGLALKDRGERAFSLLAGQLFQFCVAIGDGV